MKNLFVLFCVCIALIGCRSTPKVDTVVEAEAIRNLENQWTAANQAKDIEKIVSFWSLEGVQMPPNSAAVSGLEEIRKLNESWFNDTTYLWESYSFTIEKIEVSASGDLAYVRGINDVKIKTPTSIIQDITKGVDIWKKVDGQWKCVLGIWNSNKP
jgi:ketosteroid isomerase-like protein